MCFCFRAVCVVGFWYLLWSRGFKCQVMYSGFPHGLHIASPTPESDVISMSVFEAQPGVDRLDRTAVVGVRCQHVSMHRWNYLLCCATMSGPRLSELVSSSHCRDLQLIATIKSAR